MSWEPLPTVGGVIGPAPPTVHHRLLVADTSYDEIFLVLEGKAKAGVPKGRDGHLRTIHAPKDGDSTIVEQTRLARAQDARWW